MKLEELLNIIQTRESKLPKGSFVASLIKQGEDAVLQKIGEEATEVIIAAKGNNKQRIIEETTDLLFMLLILIVQKKITIKDVEKELERRRK